MFGRKLSLKERNAHCEAFLNYKQSKGEPYSAMEIEDLSTYGGHGGTETGNKNKSTAASSEYYTPAFVCEWMWRLAYAHGFSGGTVLDPAAGTGAFIRCAPNPKAVETFEVNPVAARICALTNPEVNIYQQSFETALLEAPNYRKRCAKGSWLKGYPFDLIIGNPPYGKYQTKYKTMFKEPHLRRFEHFFLLYGMELLKPGGLMVIITMQSFLQTRFAYSKIKHRMGEITELVDAYTIPPVFPRTKLSADILVMRRK